MFKRVQSAAIKLHETSRFVLKQYFNAFARMKKVTKMGKSLVKKVRKTGKYTYALLSFVMMN